MRCTTHPWTPNWWRLQHLRLLTHWPHIWLLGCTKVSYTQDLQHTKSKQSRKAYLPLKSPLTMLKQDYLQSSFVCNCPTRITPNSNKKQNKNDATQLAGQLFHVFADVESWVSLSRHTSSLVSQQLWVLEVEGEHHRWWIKRILDATMFLWSER